ncbi:MAG: hypothetical protein ACK469_10915 [Bacteroidota bacterium]
MDYKISHIIANVFGLEVSLFVDAFFHINLKGQSSANFVTTPLRFRYPNNELTTNAVNLNEALTRQFAGKDDVFGKMWMIQ